MSLSIIIGTIVFSLLCVFLLMALSTQSMNMLVVLGVFPLLLYLVNRPDVWLIVIIALWQSMLKFPQAPSSLLACHIFAFLLTIFLVIYRLIAKVQRRKSPVRKYVWMFAAVLLVTIYFRGIGIRFFGSDLWGGASYAILLIFLGLFLSADTLTLSPRSWKVSLIIMCFFSLIPTLGELIYLVSGGAVKAQYYFIQASGFTAKTLENIETGNGLSRYNVMGGAMFIYLPFFLFRKPFSGKTVIISVVIIIIAMASAALAGFRSAVINQIVFLTMYTVLGSDEIKLRRGFIMVLCLGSLLLIAAAFAEHLPLSMQRALSFVPFANVSWEARSDALGTTVWRLEMWKRAIYDIPQYLFLGQGFAFNPRELMDIIAAGTYIRDWAIVTRAYHNGLLSLILIFGLPGLIAGMGFLLSACRAYNRERHLEWKNDDLKRIYNVIYIQFLTQFVCFLVIYGDTQVSFPSFLFLAMVLEGMAKTREMLQQGSITTG